MEECKFCTTPMKLAWSGYTPTHYQLFAYICPSCFSTRYVGDDKDPTFQMLVAINKAFMEHWSANPTRIYVDGSGDGRFCFLIDDDPPIVRVFRKDNITHNEAEYHAVCKALIACPFLDSSNIIIFSDSKLVVNQLNKSWRINAPHLRKLAEYIWWGKDQLEDKRISFKWIPRSKNKAGKYLEAMKNEV